LQNNTDVFIAFVTVMCLIYILAGCLKGILAIYEYALCYL